MNYNRWIIGGNICRDIETKTLPNGETTVTEFAVAVNRKRKGRDDEVSYFECAAFNKVGETIAQYLKKGSPILLEGRAQQQRWESDGKKRSRVVMVVDGFQFCDAPDSRQAGHREESPAYTPDVDDDIAF